MSWFKGRDETIQAYMNSLGYFEKRALITNALHNRKVNAPFTNAQIVAFARDEDEEAWTGFNASSTALAGYDNDVVFIGKPAIDPVSGMENSEADQSGLIDKAGNVISGNLIYVAGFAVAGYLILNKIKK